jgi:DNA-binding protein Fis
MPEVLRQNAAPVAKVFLRSAGLSPVEIEVVRKLVGHSIAAVECGLICETLAWRGGNRTHAANVLGISVRALRNKIAVIAKLGMPTSESRIAGKKVYVWITQNFVEGTRIQMPNPGDHERRCCWIIR